AELFVRARRPIGFGLGLVVPLVLSLLVWKSLPQRSEPPAEIGTKPSPLPKTTGQLAPPSPSPAPSLVTPTQPRQLPKEPAGKLATAPSVPDIPQPTTKTQPKSFVPPSRPQQSKGAGQIGLPPPEQPVVATNPLAGILPGTGPSISPPPAETTNVAPPSLA